jgi:hypothetical protein
VFEKNAVKILEYKQNENTLWGKLYTEEIHNLSYVSQNLIVGRLSEVNRAVL